MMTDKRNTFKHASSEKLLLTVIDIAAPQLKVKFDGES